MKKPYRISIRTKDSVLDEVKEFEFETSLDSEQTSALVRVLGTRIIHIVIVAAEPQPVTAGGAA